MMLWIVIAAAVALAVFAFWPRSRGIDDREVRRQRRHTEGRVEREMSARSDIINPGGF